MSHTTRTDWRGVAAGVAGVLGLVALAAGWQHAAAESDRWQARYLDIRDQLNAAAESSPPDEWAARIRAACAAYPELARDPICADWTQIAPEDLHRPRVTS